MAYLDRLAGCQDAGGAVCVAQQKGPGLNPGHGNNARLFGPRPALPVMHVGTLFLVVLASDELSQEFDIGEMV